MVDPGFPRGGVTPKEVGGGRQPTIPENCMEMKKSLTLITSFSGVSCLGKFEVSENHLTLMFHEELHVRPYVATSLKHNVPMNAGLGQKLVVEQVTVTSMLNYFFTYFVSRFPVRSLVWRHVVNNACRSLTAIDSGLSFSENSTVFPKT